MLSMFLTAIFAAALLVCGAAFVFKRIYAKEKAKALEFIDKIRQPQGPDKNSLLVEFIDEMSFIFIQRLETRLKAQSMQMEGAIKRQANKIEAEMTKSAIANKSPILGAIMELAPESAGLSKLLKTPAALEAVSRLAGGMFGGGAETNNGNGQSKQLYALD